MASVAVKNLTSSALSVEVAPRMSIVIEPGAIGAVGARVAKGLLAQVETWAPGNKAAEKYAPNPGDETKTEDEEGS